ncbi:MAG: LPD25 domain-containing protein [Streptococcus mitis]|nr:LPD25 domain-containing protein [Streptococcus mitis]
MTEQESRRGKSRRERVEFARSRDILDVANELQMELVRSGRDYRWKEHDSLVISPDKNLWKWFSRNTGGDSISLVETIKEVDFNQSVDFLNDGNFKEFQMVERPQEYFKYYLEKYEQPLSAGRDYLRSQRGLSDETIDYFLEQGILAQANAKLDYFAEGTAGVTTNAIEPVIVFKSLSSSGEVVGASLQGIQENWEKWPKHGYAKVIMKNSDPMTGIHVDIGSPKRLIFTESPIDLMSYYELHKDSLQDVRLVSMDGLKESTIGRHLSQIKAEMSGKALIWTPEQLADGLQVAIDHHFFEDGKNADLITLALDNDKAGRTFIQELEAKGAVINSDLPELRPGQDKTDWNDVLKNQQEDKPDNSRLAQARRKLERLRGEQDDAISRAYSHQALTNGQPMNDKRDGASFMRKQEQIEGQIFSKMDEIRQQEERVERLDHQQRLKEMGLNRQGSGLEMSVQNIPRIREELAKAERGESFFTKATLKRYQEELTRLEAISEQMGKTSIQPATQALIDEGLVNQWQKQPNTYFVKGLRRVALELTEEGEFQLSSQTKYHPKTDEERLKVDELLAKQAQGNAGVKQMIEEERSSVPPELSVAFDFTENPNLSQKFSSGDVIPYKDFIAQLYEENNLRMLSLGYDKTYFALQDEEGNRLTDDLRYDIGSEKNDLSTQLGEVLPSPYLEQAQKADYDYHYQDLVEENVQLDSVVSEEKEKSLDNNQETNTGGELLNRNSSSLGVETPGTAPQPVEKNSQPDFPTNVHLHFTIDEDRMSNKKFRKNMRTLNLYANAMRDSAQWYLKEMSGTSIHYVYKNPEEKQFQILNVKFDKKNWMHLTGVTPVYNEWVEHLSESFVEDVAAGKGHFKDLKFANGMSDKLKVLNLLPEVIESDSFVFNDLSSVKKFNNLDLSKAIRPEDTDLLLLFKEKEFTHVPASLMRVKGDLSKQLEDIDTGTILGVYRERDGHIEQLSINEEYVKDGGEEMLSVLKNRQFEEIKPTMNVDHQVKISSYNFNNQEYSDLESMLQAGASYLQTPEGKAWLLEDKEYHQDILLKSFESKVSTPKQKLAVMSELGSVRVNGYELLPGMDYYDALRDDGKYLDNEVIKRIDDELLNLSSGVSAEEELHYEEQLIDLAESRGIAEQENHLNQTSLDSATFTQVLDTVYNLGVPDDISKTPEEFHQAWNQYLDYAKQHNDKFDQIVAVAVEDHLLDTNSDFYKEWKQDYIYKEHYHVRLQWSEERPNGPRLPFKETELISYQDFARELYKANQDFYPIHQEGMKQVTAGNTEGYIPPTKIKFDIYAPGGEMIKEGIRYDIGDETTPISQMLGLGYRRLNGQSELASMDEEILSQLENRVVNKEISQEANESSRLMEEGEGQTPDTRETVAFQSSKQEIKTNFLQRVEEILKEEPILDLETPEVNPSSIDYATLTPHELSEVAFQKVREYTETPERLEEYLNFMSKFPELSPRNVALIQEQWPGASAVATYNQWQSMREVLGITSDQVFETRNTYTNKKTGRTREVVHNNLSVKTGEKSHIILFRPMMVEMIPVLDENGNQVKNGKGNPKYKRLSEATPEEKALKKEGKLKSRFFQERDSNTGLAKFATYKVFELSQTTLKPEFYPKAMPNRHYDFNMDHIRTKEVLEGLSDYAKNIGVTIYQDDAKELRSAKGAFYSDEQKILLNPDNTPGEVVATTIHELAHATLHNPKFANSYKEDVSKDRRELEAEMTSYLVSKHFGLDTSEKAIRYMAIWTDNLTSLDDQQLAQSMKRIHGTVSKIVKSVEQHTKPYQLNRQVVQNQNFIQSPKKGLKV